MKKNQNENVNQANKKKTKKIPLTIDGHQVDMHRGIEEVEVERETMVPFYDQDGVEVGYKVVKPVTRVAYQGSGLNSGNDFSAPISHLNTKHVPKPAVYNRNFGK